MKKFNKFILMLISIALILTVACGSGEDTSSTKVGETQTSGSDKTKGTEDKGAVVAKEILATYDKAVAEIVELLKDKPEPESVKPGIEGVLQKYGEKMKLLNTKYLDLKKKDIRLFGSANTYLGENRGKHVFKKDNALDIYLSHYMYTVKNDDLVNLLKKGLFDLLETAIKR